MAAQQNASIHPARLVSLIDAFAGLRVLVFGDLIVDEFIYGEIARVLREAPVLILNYDSTAIVPGGAGNAAGDVAALGGAAGVVGAAGEDDNRRRLFDAVRPQIGGRGVGSGGGVRTPTKARSPGGGSDL